MSWHFLTKYHSITETYSGSELPGIPHQVPVTEMGQVDQIVHAWVLHYSDTIMGAAASQITSLPIVYSTVYSDAEKTSKLRVTLLCAGNSPRHGEFLAQMSSNAENFSIWKRHHCTVGNIYHWYFTADMILVEYVGARMWFVLMK